MIEHELRGVKLEKAGMRQVSADVRTGWRRLKAIVPTLATTLAVIVASVLSAFAWTATFATSPAAVQEAFTQLPDGRYIVDFHGYRFALVRWGERYDPSVDLCFVGQPRNFPHGKSWDQRIEWTLTRILEDPGGFRKELAQAKSITTYQGIPTTKIEVRPGDRVLLPLSALGARMFLTIDVSRFDDEPCPGSGHPYSELDDTRRYYEGSRHGSDYLAEAGSLLIYRSPYDRRIATGKIERFDRDFPAFSPVYLRCVSYECKRFAVNDAANIEVDFAFNTGSDSIDPAMWIKLDRYFHETTSYVFLGHTPDGIE